MRKFIASVLSGYYQFVLRHPLLSLVTSFAMLAAIAGALYLIYKQFPSFLVWPCFTGGGCS